MAHRSAHPSWWCCRIKASTDAQVVTYDPIVNTDGPNSAIQPDFPLKVAQSGNSLGEIQLAHPAPVCHQAGCRNSIPLPASTGQ